MRYVTNAPKNTPCQWTAPTNGLPCASGQYAVHTVTVPHFGPRAGTALCAFHSPYDVVKWEGHPVFLGKPGDVYVVNSDPGFYLSPDGQTVKVLTLHKNDPNGPLNGIARVRQLSNPIKGREVFDIGTRTLVKAV